MHGYDIRLSDEPGDVIHIDTSEPLSDKELKALAAYFRAVMRQKRRGS